MHKITTTEAKTTESRVVAKKGYPYGVRKDFTRKTYGYKCSCGMSYGAYEGAASRTDARQIAKEDHAS
jgi:hypothetical protein